jgi:hypothetical protein
MSGLYTLHNELGLLHSDPIYYNRFNELYSEIGRLHNDPIHLWWIGI